MAGETEEKEGGEDKAPESKAGGKRKIIIAVGAIAALLLVIGVPLMFVLGGKSKEQKVEEPGVDITSHGRGDRQPEGFDDEEALDEGEEPLGTFFPLDTFVVNLARGGYVRVTFQLEFNQPDVPARFLRRVVPVRDSIIFLLGTYSAEDITSSNGKRELKLKVKELVNEAMRKEVVKEVYLTQFIVQ